MVLSTTKFTALSSCGFNFFLGLFVSFLLIGCGSESKIAVAAGSDHSLALDSEGNVYATGRNDGQLGLSKVNSNCGLHTLGIFGSQYKYYCRVFTKVPSLKNKNITAISAGYFHSLALDSNGKVYVSGLNYNGQLGFGDNNNRTTFTEVSSLKSKNITVISAAGGYSLALDSDGRVYGAGWNSYGQLGLGDTNDRNIFTEVSSLKSKNITAISAGSSHSLALDSNGKVYTTGWNRYGQLGFGNIGINAYRNTFVEIPSLEGKNIIAISAGYSHSFALDSNGSVYATGSNSNGELGLGDNNDRTTFTEVLSLKGKNIIAIAAGTLHSFAIDNNGKVYAAGENYNGKLGFGDTNDRNIFTEVSSLNGVTAIVAGGFHSLALDSDGKVYAAGSNYYGQLGLDDRENYYTSFTETF